MILSFLIYAVKNWNTHFQLTLLKYLNEFLKSHQPEFIKENHKDLAALRRYNAFTSVWNSLFHGSLKFYKEKMETATQAYVNKNKPRSATKDIAKYRKAVSEIIDLFLPEAIAIAVRAGKVVFFHSFLCLLY